MPRKTASIFLLSQYHISGLDSVGTYSSCSSASPVPNGVVNSYSSKHHRRINSAETVALSLLSFRPDAHQAEPRVSDLEWLVGDGDTPQKVQKVTL